MITHNCEQRSAEWYALRAGMPTASEFSSLITSTGEPSKSLAGYALSLAAEKFAGRTLDTFQGTPWTERGQEMEAEAIRCYQFTADLDVDPVGFLTDDLKRYGCSPDGLVGAEGGVEVKCLKAENHIKAILYHQKHGKAHPEYVQQVQGALMITGRKWWDQVFYHPDLPLLIVRQIPQVPLFVALARGIEDVCEERDRVLVALQRQAEPGQQAA